MRGRPLRVDWQADDTEAALKARYQAERRLDLRPRLQALWLVRTGRSLGEVARVLGVHYVSVQRWVRWYRAGGVAGLAQHRQAGKGKPAKLSVDQQQGLLAELATGRFRTAAQIRAWVEETYGVRYTAGGMYGLLTRLRCAPKVPRPLHERADLAAQDAWKKGA